MFLLCSASFAAFVELQTNAEDRQLDEEQLELDKSIKQIEADWCLLLSSLWLCTLGQLWDATRTPPSLLEGDNCVFTRTSATWFLSMSSCECLTVVSALPQPFIHSIMPVLTVALPRDGCIEIWRLRYSNGSDYTQHHHHQPSPATTLRCAHRLPSDFLCMQAAPPTAAALIHVAN